jgi:hypothetical protein
MARGDAATYCVLYTAYCALHIAMPHIACWRDASMMGARLQHACTLPPPTPPPSYPSCLWPMQANLCSPGGRRPSERMGPASGCQTLVLGPSGAVRRAVGAVVADRGAAAPALSIWEGGEAADRGAAAPALSVWEGSSISQCAFAYFGLHVCTKSCNGTRSPCMGLTLRCLTLFCRV